MKDISPLFALVLLPGLGHHLSDVQAAVALVQAQNPRRFHLEEVEPGEEDLTAGIVGPEGIKLGGQEIELERNQV